MSSHDETFDQELERLFRSMDEVKASDELKASTLSAIFDAMDEEESRLADKGVPRAGNVLAIVPEENVAPEAAGAAERPDATPEQADPTPETGTAGRPDATPGQADPTPEQVSGSKSASAPRKRPGWLKIAAALLVAFIGVGGFLSYALPTNRVVVSADDTTFELGVNVYGATVSVTSDSDAGKAAISSADVHNVGFQDAIGRLLDAYDQQHGGEPNAISVEARDQFGNRNDAMVSEADRVIEGRAAPQSEQGSAGQAPQEHSAPESGANASGAPNAQGGEAQMGELGSGSAAPDGGQSATSAPNENLGGEPSVQSFDGGGQVGGQAEGQLGDQGAQPGQSGQGGASGQSGQPGQGGQGGMQPQASPGGQQGSGMGR